MSSSRREPYRVIIWGPGYTGLQAAREVLARPEMRIVGCLAYSPSKEGRDLGELLDGNPLGVVITTDKEKIYALEADVVIVTARAMPDETECHEDIARLLRSGKNVVTTTSYHFPWQRGEAFVAPIEAACAEGGSTLLGTGVHPGWFIERLVPTLTSLCASVERVRLAEVVDLRHHSGEAVRGMGYGMPPQRLGSTKRKLILSRYYFESLAYIAHVLGVRLDRIESDIRYVTTPRSFDVAAVHVAAGTVGCVDGTWTGFVGDDPFVSLRELLYVDPDLVSDFEITSPDFYDVAIAGRPLDVATRVDLSVTDTTDVYGIDDGQGGANLATAVQAVLTVPAAVAAPPGILTPHLFAHPTEDLRDIPNLIARRPVSVPELIR